MKYEFNYAPFIKTTGQALSSVTLTAACKDFQQPLWIFADSYGGVALNRWPGQLRSMGFFNFMEEALAGINSANALLELQRALQFGTPKYLVWCLGMNDTDFTAYMASLSTVITLCSQKGITLIICTIPQSQLGIRKPLTPVSEHRIIGISILPKPSELMVPEPGIQGT